MQTLISKTTIGGEVVTVKMGGGDGLPLFWVAEVENALVPEHAVSLAAEVLTSIGLGDLSMVALATQDLDEDEDLAKVRVMYEREEWV